MIAALVRGATAGAVGTLALESVTYLDMLITGRSESELPAQAVEQLTEALGVDLGAAAANRKKAIGALLGMANGIAVGAAYGVVTGGARTTRRRGLTLAVAAMLAGNGPATISGLTDPRRWGWRGWLEDVVPHLAYGVVTSRVYAALRAV